jgi:hypothetical protein
MAQPPEPKQEPTLQEKLADIAVKAIMAGGVTAGGVGAFWSLFQESDVPKAIASAVIGVGITYGASLLRPIHQGTQRRLERTGKAIDQAIDRSVSQIAEKAVGVEDRYLAAQALDCQSYRPEGVAQREGVFAPLLEEVFVPLALDTSALSPGFRALEQEFSPDRSLSIWDFIGRSQKNPTFRQMAVLAWGGYGKTTLLKHVAYVYGKKQHER